MIIDHTKALRILEEETSSAQSTPVSGEWVDRVKQLSKLADRARTHIAMLGTALLAKATNPLVDVFAIKVSAGTPGAYSARALAKDVLAANAPRLGIDLGVTGREPLNNQPYFRGVSINADLARFVRGNARPAFNYLRECLAILEKLDSQDARLALRAFLQMRQQVAHSYQLSHESIGILETSFVNAVNEFTGMESEGGRRAQAVVAGLLEAMYDSARILVARINDPDRHFPGDVALQGTSQSDKIERTFEVRDKPVTDNDLYGFVNKVSRRGISRAAVVAAMGLQGTVDRNAVANFAQANGVKLIVYEGWQQFIAEALFHGQHTDPFAVLEGSAGSVLSKLEDLEVSERGITIWISLMESCSDTENTQPSTQSPIY